MNQDSSQKIYNLFFDYLSQFFEVSQREQLFIKKFWLPQTTQKDEYLVRTGTVCKHIYFVAQGALRTYSLHENGEEYTRIIALENNFCSSLDSFVNQLPNTENIQSIEDSLLLKITLSDFQTITNHSHDIEKLYSKILEERQRFNTKRVNSFIALTAQQRVEEVFKDNPEYFERVPNSILSSYLGIRPETLSRIKSKIIFSN